ncbi:MAG: hypothetical protein K2N64_04540 [Anaeroplasmataceae bacterium]|nr:hypothetical protein [Anaeroplasmataceae bacterium]
MKKSLKLLFSAVVLCLGLFLVSCTETEQDKQTAYVSLDINPAIELVVDQENKVVSVRGENEDGQVLLFEETGITGVDIHTAIEKITKLAIDLGYLDENNQVVDTIIASENEEFKAQLQDKVHTTITATASNLGLEVKTNTEGAYSLIRKMNALKEKFPNNKAIQGMSVQKFKLALSASQTGDISIEAAIELDDTELISMIQTANEQIEQFATDAYIEAKKKAFALYEQATEVAGYAVYTKFYVEHMLSHPMTAYYGGVYQMYATASKSFLVMYDMAKLTSKVSEYPLNEAQIKAIMISLGMAEDEIELLKNSSGEITIQSIENYADKLFKNSITSSQLEEMKQNLTKSLNQAERNIEELVSKLTEKYRPQIEETIENAKELVASLESVMSVLPESVKVILNDCIKDFKDITASMQVLLEDGSFDLEDLKSFAKKLEGKAEEYYQKIKADLSDAELKEVEERKAEVINKMTEQKKELEAKLLIAEQEAKAKLTEIKASRKLNKA